MKKSVVDDINRATSGLAAAANTKLGKTRQTVDHRRRYPSHIQTHVIPSV